MGTRGGRPEPVSTAARGKQQRSRGATQPGPGKAGSPRAGSRPGGDRPRQAARSAAAPAKETAAAGPPAWFRWTTLVLSLIGLGVSIYLTYTHYTEPRALACPDTGAINCTKVTTSAQSMVFGIFPVAVLGLVFYVFMTAVTSPWGWRAASPVIRWARLIGAAAGILFVFYLIYVEALVVHAICLWCTGVHVVTFLLFVLIMVSAAAWGVSQPAAGRE